MSSLPKLRYTPQQYLEMERKAESKSEYVNGIIWPCGEAYPPPLSQEDAQLRQEQVRRNILSVLRSRLPKDRIRSNEGDTGFTAMRQDEQFVVLQILSSESEGWDRGEGFARQRRNPALWEYVMVSLERPFIERWERHSANRWTMTETIGLKASIRLPTIGCELSLSQIYTRVEFPPETTLPKDADL